MASERKTGPKGAETRARLLDIAEHLMLDEGYAAVTTRRVAGIAGVNPALVHYYFPVTDDLFLAVFRHGADRALERQQAASASAQPLRAMWAQWLDPRGTGLVMEFTALANHRKAVRAELADYGQRHRAVEIEAVARVFAEYGVDPDEMTPEQLVLQMTAVARMLVVEDAMGLTAGHDAARAPIEAFLDHYEPLPRAAARRKPAPSKRAVSATRRPRSGTR
jgi:AcrR family transcriptional regulator